MNQPSKIQVDLEDGTRSTFKPKANEELKIVLTSFGRIQVLAGLNMLFDFDAQLVKRAYVVTPNGRFITYKRDWR